MCFFSRSLSFFIENITGRLYNIQNSKLCFRDMKIMSLRNGGDFGKQLVLRTRCLPNHHHSFVTIFSYHGNTVNYSLYLTHPYKPDGKIKNEQLHVGRTLAARRTVTSL